MIRSLIRFASQEITFLASSAISIRAIGIALAFLGHVLFAKALSPSEYGGYTLVVTISTVLIAICMQGFDYSAQKFLPGYLTTQSNAEINRFISFAFRRIFIWGLVAAVVLSLSAMLVSPQDIKPMVYLGGVLVVAMALAQLFSAILRAHKKVTLALLPIDGLRPLVVVVAGAGMLLNPSWASSMNAMITISVSSLLCLYILYITCKNQIGLTVPLYKSVKEDTEWTKVSFPLYATSLLGLLQTQMDILLIGWLMDHESIGIYAITSRIAALVWLGGFAVSTVAGALISEKLTSKNARKELHELFKNIGIGQILYTFPIAALLLQFPDKVLGVLGLAYINGSSALMILTVAFVLAALCGPTGVLMGVTGHQKAGMKISALWLFIQLILIVALIPLFGINGAAIATAIGFSGRIFSMLIYVRIYIGFDCSIMSIFKKS